MSFMKWVRDYGAAIQKGGSMKHYRILYRWQDREYCTTMPGRTAAHALMFAQLQIMPGARVFAVEVPA